MRFVKEESSHQSVSHYRVFVSFDDERRMNERCPTWEAEIKQFYKLGASIPAEIVAT
jgi:hypothetical protein